MIYLHEHCTVYCTDVWYMGKLSLIRSLLACGYNYLATETTAVFYIAHNMVFTAVPCNRLMHLNSEIQLIAYKKIFEYPTTTIRRPFKL